MIVRDHRHQAGHHRPSTAGRGVSSRVQALLCLLTLCVQLALAVTHTCEVSIDAVTASPAFAVPHPATGTGDPTRLLTAAIAPRHGSHDHLLCPVCQFFSQAKSGLAPSLAWSDIGMVLRTTPVACPLDSTVHPSDLDCATSTPRAPPFVFSHTLTWRV